MHGLICVRPRDLSHRTLQENKLEMPPWWDAKLWLNEAKLFFKWNLNSTESCCQTLYDGNYYKKFISFPSSLTHLFHLSLHLLPSLSINSLLALLVSHTQLPTLPLSAWFSTLHLQQCYVSEIAKPSKLIDCYILYFLHLSSLWCSLSSISQYFVLFMSIERD